jgi:hypothetical protein
MEQPISPMQDITSIEESPTCSILKLAMDLLLRRHHRQNIERQQRRVLSGWKDRWVVRALHVCGPALVARYSYNFRGLSAISRSIN